jgi:cytidine deaminase
MKEVNFNELYEIAKNKMNPWKVSPFVEAGGVSAAILTKDDNIYTGVCIDTACSLGMCAERNAIANMITNGKKDYKTGLLFLEWRIRIAVRSVQGTSNAT